MEAVRIVETVISSNYMHTEPERVAHYLGAAVGNWNNPENDYSRTQNGHTP